jgi:GNAT superfamily N-acetyltransferase
MSDLPWGGTFRKLWPSETEKFRDHLLRLDQTSRRMRFAHAVSDSFIEDYASHVSDTGNIVHAWLDESGTVRAAAELKQMGGAWGREAEAAFSVEAAFQDRGIGRELMGRVIRSARNRGVAHLFMSCLPNNQKMQAIARRFDAELSYEYGEVVGDIIPESSNYFSIMAEEVDDSFGLMMAVFDLRNRRTAAA